MTKLPNYVTLTAKTSKYKMLFRRYSDSTDETKKNHIYFIDVWKKSGLNGSKSYSAQIFHECYLHDEDFPYEFDISGLFKCLDEHKDDKQIQRGEEE